MSSRVANFLEYISTEYPHLFAGPEELDDSYDAESEHDEEIEQEIDDRMAETNDLSQIESIIDEAQAHTSVVDDGPVSDDNDEVVNDDLDEVNFKRILFKRGKLRFQLV